MNKEQYKAHLRQRLYEGDIPTIDRSPTNNILNAGIDLINGGIGIANTARSIFGPSATELIANGLTDSRNSGTDIITNDTSALRYAARDIPGVAAVERKMAEAGYFPKGGFYDRNNDGKEDSVYMREYQAKLAKMTPAEREAYQTKSADQILRFLVPNPRVVPPILKKTIMGHEGEIPNSDPLPSDTQRA